MPSDGEWPRGYTLNLFVALYIQLGTRNQLHEHHTPVHNKYLASCIQLGNVIHLTMSQIHRIQPFVFKFFYCWILLLPGICFRLYFVLWFLPAEDSI